ncbi:MAG: sigma-70 family RNA polymerase sigma factor [Kiritimatiellae bacterium]|nr:sigma-70 family RNA polymerase sigma factor [Kiritimatiellia bacterium]
MTEPGQLSDEALARATQAGATCCYEELVRRYENRLFRFLVQKTGNRQDAEDLTQAAFIRAYRHIGRFNAACPFRGWLFTIAARLAISHHRRARPTAELRDDVADAGAADPAEAAAARDEAGRLWESARRRLTDDQFTALWLKYAESMGVREIAGVMRKSHVHVKVLLHRARQALAAVLPQRKEAHDAVLLV